MDVGGLLSHDPRGRGCEVISCHLICLSFQLVGKMRWRLQVHLGNLEKSCISLPVYMGPDFNFEIDEISKSRFVLCQSDPVMFTVSDGVCLICFTACSATPLCHFSYRFMKYLHCTLCARYT